MSNLNDDLGQRLRSSLDRGAAPHLSADLVSGAGDHPTPHLANPARTLRIAGSAGLLVVAVTVGALVLGPGMSRGPLFTAATSAQASALGASDAMTGDAKMMMWVEYRYSAGPSLSTAGGSGSVYQLVRDTADPRERAAELASVFGVDGDVTKAEFSDATYPTWMVGPQDGSGVNLTLSAYGTGDWWFNDPTVSSVYVCDPSVTEADAETYDCILPAEAPANQAPTGEKARSLAKALFASTGYDVSAADIEITSSADGTSASAYLTVDGIRTALGWNAYWTNTGGLAYAYGYSVHPEARGTFGTVSPTDAVQRMADYRWFGAPGPEFQGGAMMFAKGAVEDDGPVAVEEPGVPTGEPTDEPTDEPPVESTDPSTPSPEETLPPIDVEPTPEVVDVTVDNATATLLLLWDADGNAWLVPGYAMQMPEGWWNAVVSLVEGVIALPEQQ